MYITAKLDEYTRCCLLTPSSSTHTIENNVANNHLTYENRWDLTHWTCTYSRILAVIREYRHTHRSIERRKPGFARKHLLYPSNANTMSAIHFYGPLLLYSFVTSFWAVRKCSWHSQQWHSNADRNVNLRNTHFHIEMGGWKGLNFISSDRFVHFEMSNCCGVRSLPKW